eukprot:Ihof_evm1s900 gene=Ihof_evmTU1s900
MDKTVLTRNSGSQNGYEEQWNFKGPRQASAPSRFWSSVKALYTYRDQLNMTLLFITFCFNWFLFVSYCTTHHHTDCLNDKFRLKDTPAAMNLRKADQGIGIFLIILFGFRGVTSTKSSWMFVRNHYKEILVDGFTLYPLFLSAVNKNLYDLYIPNFLRIWPIMWHFRLMTLDPLYAAGYYMTIRMIDVFTFLFTYIISFTCAFKYTANCYTPTNTPVLDWSATIYFVITTISTIGYGDILPISKVSRWLLVVMIFVVSMLVPSFFSQMADILRQARMYSKHYYGRGHILVCGDLSPSVMSSLYKRLHYMQYLGLFNGHLVVLSNQEPDDLVRMMHQRPFIRDYVVFLNGSSLDEKALARANAEHARAIIILSDLIQEGEMATKSDKYRMGSVLDLLDMTNGQRAWSIQLHAPEVPLYLEFLRAENVYQVNNLGNCKRVIPRSFCKSNLLAGGCLHKGFPAFALNLCQVIQTQNFMQETKVEDQKTWNDEYEDGVVNNVHSITVAPAYVGMTFSQISLLLYTQTGCIVFAVCENGPPEEEPTCGNPEIPISRHLQFNPGPDYVIQEEDVLVYAGRKTIDMEAAMRGPGRMIEHSFIHAMEQPRTFPTDITDNEKATIMGNGKGWMPPRSMQTSTKKNCLPAQPASEGVEQDQVVEEVIVGYPDSYLGCRINRCFVTAEPRDLAKATVEKLIGGAFINQVSPGWRNHVILVGSGVHEPFSILEILRLTRLGRNNCPVVVLLCPVPLSEDDWVAISRFPDVYCMIGNGHSLHDLHRAGIRYASAIMSIADSFATHDDDTQDLEDALTLMTLNKAKSEVVHNPALNVVLELVNESSIRFVSNGLPETKNMTVFDSNMHMQPSYAAGSVVIADSSSMFVFQNALLPKAYDVFCCLLSGTANGAYL